MSLSIWRLSRLLANRLLQRGHIRNICFTNDTTNYIRCWLAATQLFSTNGRSTFLSKIGVGVGVGVIVGVGVGVRVRVDVGVFVMVGVLVRVGCSFASVYSFALVYSFASGTCLRRRRNDTDVTDSA